MTNVIWLVGADPRHVEGWIAGADKEIRPLPDQAWDLAAGADWVIEASAASLRDKRDHLRQLASCGVKRVLSTSGNATVAAQTAWLNGGIEIVGCDGLLMAAGGRVQTVVHAGEIHQSWLSSVWPERRFVDVEDAVGLVFSRELLPIINEAVEFFSHDVSQHDIDRGLRLGLNYPKGPLEWAEVFGWPAVCAGLKALEDMYGPRFRPHPWIRRAVGSSWRGDD